jgi:hypothetical protein
MSWPVVAQSLGGLSVIRSAASFSKSQADKIAAVRVGVVDAGRHAVVPAVHVWPTRHEHINFYGQYHFNIEEAQQRQGLRSLRQPGMLSLLA